MADLSFWTAPSTIGFIAGIIGILSFVPYIVETLNRKITPNRATWLIWMVMGLIIAASYYSAGARATAWVPAAYAVGITVMALLTLKYGEGGWTKLDLACLGGAGVGLVLWAVTSDPVLPLFLTIAIDAIGAVPTIKKAYERPESESALSWYMYVIANGLNLFAIQEWTLVVASYPVYVFVLSIVMSALLARPRNKKNL